MSEVSAQVLHVVARELNTELGDARAALEAFGERQDDIALLEGCGRHLHQVQGVLRVVEVYGAALLAEEMEQVVLYLVDTFAEKRHLAEGLDALMRAMVQLPTYLERVMGGGRDMALVLLPLLNDLRAVRGSPLLSEGTLLLLNLTSDQPANPVQATTGSEESSVGHWARALRTRFQLGLLGWIKGEQADQNLEILSRAAEKLEQVAATQPVFQLWWVVGALLEALREGGLEGSASVKRLLGQADRELRRLYQLGEGRYSESPPLELLNNLLYYVARSGTSGPRVTAVRTSFRLGELLPVDEQIAEARESLSAPSVRLMKTVAAAIKDDLARVKDALDIFVRKGASQVEELSTQLEMLKKIGDTLGVLGLGEFRDRVQSEIVALQAILSRQAPVDDAALFRMAATLIGIEDSLDGQLVGLIVPAGESPAAATGTTQDDTEFRHVTEAVLRECIVNMARIKEAVALMVERRAENPGLDQVPQLIRGITAGLLMLGKSRAVEVTEGIAAALDHLLRTDRDGLASDHMDRLADAIVSVEYYMETLQAGRSDPWYMLDNAENCLRVLDGGSGDEAPVPDMPAVAESPAADDSTLAVEPPGAATTLVGDFERTTVMPAPSVVAARAAGTSRSGPVEPPPVLAPSADKDDPEFLELFIEEARDEIARIGAQFPGWDENPQDHEALVSLRRSFHTLKGSGRMVGALRIGEVAWAIESMLNRVISQTLARTPEMMELLRYAIRVMPALVEQLETGRDPGIDVADLITRARAISGVPAPVAAEPRPVEPIAEPVSEPAVVAASQLVAPSARPPEQIDPVLHDIFAKETAAHLATIRDFLRTAEQAPPPHPVTEALHRSCHTLSGIAKTAGARQGIKIAEPLNHYIRKLYDGGLGLPEDGIAVLRDAVSAIESVVEHLSEDTGFFASHAAIGMRLHELERKADQELAARGEVTVFSIDLLVPQGESAEALQAVVPEGLAVPSAVEPAGESMEVVPEEKPAIETADASSHEQGFDVLATPETPEPEPEPLLEPESVPEDEFDADIAAIFTEEATELLDAADAALAGWSRDPADGSHVFEFKRALHTLKGGARMAGIRAMGDLGHEVESFMLAIETGTVRADAQVFSTMQASLDALHHMREAVIQGKRVVPARDLVQRIRALGQPDIQSGLTAEPVADTVPPGMVKAYAPAGEPGPLVDVAEAVDAVEAAGATVEQAGRESAQEVLEVQDVKDVQEVQEVQDVSGVQGADAEDKEAAEEAEQVSDEVEQLAPADEVSEPAAAAPALLPPGREPQVQERHDVARVDAELLDTLLNNAGEVSIFRSRLEQQVGSIEFNLAELGRTVTRLKEQLRKLEIETETQILHRHQDETGGRGDFDPLELDRYSMIQQLSRALAESVSDVASIEGLLENLSREAQNLLMQQARVVTELQSGLMRTRMVPFQRHVQRLSRLVRQVAADTGKQAELVVTGASGELDRQVLERMLPPFEHMLRNAVVHGIESMAERHALGKPEAGTIRVALTREGAEIVIVIEDDGRGIDIQAVRERARQRGMLQSGRMLTDEEALQLVLEPGFSTAGSVTQHAGRGVGMDVVVTEIKKLGGALFTQSTPGRGTRFTVRLPFTLAISQALVVRVADELYALPLPTVEGVTRVPREEVLKHLAEGEPTYSYGGQAYRFQHLGAFVGAPPAVLPEVDVPVPVILIRAGEHSAALVTDELVGSREIVVKSVGPQIAGIRGISGATILGDGRIVIILDMGALVRSEWRGRSSALVRPAEDRRVFALVVDDSITVRRVTQRLLERNGMRVMTAKDGVDALSILQEHVPDIVLLDIEMPRMDGYELAAQIRSDPRLVSMPIVMITSRVGEKHRARAIELGVNDYLGKPYQESQLLDAIDPLVEAHRRRQAS